MLTESLHALAAAYGVQPGFLDSFGHWRTASPEAAVEVLRCLGAELARPEDAPEALRARHEELTTRVLEPVVVHWLPEGASPERPAPFRITVRPGPASGPYRVRLQSETGEEALSWEGKVEEAGGEGGAERHLCGPPFGTAGVFSLVLSLGGREHRATLFSAPMRAWSRPGAADWGVFAPTYALRSARDETCEQRLGVGDLSHLRQLVDWVGERGGHAVSTLPLLAQFLDEIFEPSPYSPASRLFWNEFYLSLEQLPELASCEHAQTLLACQEFRQEIAGAGRSVVVDYGARVTAKRLVLEHLAQAFFDAGGDREPAFQRFLDRPRVQAYARFRATGETLRRPFQTWPSWAARGKLGGHCHRQGAYRYHLYCQYRMAEQMSLLGDRARALGLGLYLDLPVGVHSSGFDLWEEPEAFLLGCAAGAPPDIVFTGGQDWGTAPLSPEGLRKQGYRYLRDVLAHHLGCAGALRIDHVMGIDRIYCVPKGFDATNGVYVGYRKEEILALMCIESHRYKSMLVGEDLGTIPPGLPEALERHGIRRMHVLEYALAGDRVNFESLTGNVAASVNTHDLFPLAGWCEGEDLRQRRELDQLTDDQLEAEWGKRKRVLQELAGQYHQAGRIDQPVLDFPLQEEAHRAVLGAVLEHYGGSEAPLVLVNLEDLWAEKLPQNVPGTTTEAGNWQRRLRHDIEAVQALPGVAEVLGRLEKRRGEVRQAEAAE